MSMKVTKEQFVGMTYEELISENDKLRELAKTAWSCVNSHVSCDECRIVCCGCTLQSAMRELGIEEQEGQK